MKVFGIGDLHLSTSGEKPMDVFGPEWAGHAEKLAENWRAAVRPEDAVLLCGDLSWAMRLDEALPDLAFIDALPGRKYLIRGNHDYWYSSPAKVRAALGPSMHLIRFDAAVHGRVGICGVRGWPCPGFADYDPETGQKHWRRTVMRFGLSLNALKALDWDVAIAMFHHPPRGAAEPTELSRMVVEAGVRHCIYGHVHGPATASLLEGEVDGVTWRCVSADRVGFRPELLVDGGA